MSNPELCTIAFQGEAHDSAAQAFHAIEGYSVTVVPTAGDTFHAEVIGLEVDPRDGQFRVRLAKWDEEAGRGDREDVVTLNIYEDIDRVEVI